MADRADGSASSAAHLAAAVQQGADSLRSQILAAANGAVAVQTAHQPHVVHAGPAQAQDQQAQQQQQHDPTNPFLAPPAEPQQASQQQQQQPQHSPEELAAEQRRAAEAAAARAAAEAARARHVPLVRGGSGRAAGGRGRGQLGAARQPASPPVQPPRVATDERGAFRGFE